MSAVEDSELRTADAAQALYPDPGLFFVGFERRLVCVVLDAVIVISLAVVAHEFVLEPIGLDFGRSRATIFTVMLLYFAAFWSSPMRATPVQFAFGARIVDEAGKRLTPGRAVARSVLLVVLIVPATMLFKVPLVHFVGVVALAAYALLFLAALTPNRQAGHDLLVHSLVVDKKF